jgi:hypothetical protein
MNRRRVVGVGVVLATLVLILSRMDRVAVVTPDPPRPAAAGSPAGIDPDGLTVLRDTGFDLRYAAPGGTAEDDLRLVAGLLDDVVLLVKDFDRFPLADNEDFAAFLQGENPHRVAWIRPGHPAVSARGELLDRWNHPLFFHRESSRRTTLRSAGADGTMWTDDDVVWPREP